ncbi:glycosyltransferase family 4 protein [Sphingomonas sp. SUN019]|uniref:glycosyltransferase family 4 protein n=1 Tax=Sphingomonas sp. SUN019 TaxID=2937788 RepID=UPI002164497E|nr:glycosyltransferase family 1 protein [Sphingomonas sp. SUN019]UVO52381.1 glycosyltransferase family 4 protein [Sphingomonas sp. SUN019]
MRIVVDGRLDASAATGVASYARAVHEGLSAIGRAPLILDDATHGQFGTPSPPLARAWRGVRGSVPLAIRLSERGGRLMARDVFRLAQARFALTGRLLRLTAPGPPGVMHWTYPIPARIEGWRNVYTVHDVIPLLDAGFSPIDPERLRRQLAAVAAGADRIVTVSQWARGSIIDTLALDPAQVTDCGLAVAGMSPADALLPGGLARDGYFLFCGLTEPRKNLDRIIAGWAASGSGRPLVVVGPDAASIAPRAGLVALPYQPRGVLIDLIAGARALVFATLEEGFGLPIAEAMTLGTPVITSDRGAPLEVTGGAALTVDPADVAQIAAAIARLDQSDDLCAALKARGLERAVAFTAAAFGVRLAALYDEFAGDSRMSG